MRKHVSAAAAAAALAAVALAGCSPQDPVRSLLGEAQEKAVSQNVLVDNPNAQRVLRLLADEAVAVARLGGGWEGIDMDVANTLLDEVLAVPADYPHTEWGGQVYSVSVKPQKDSWLAASIGEGETCWYLKLQGTPQNPTLSFAVALNRLCQADTQVELKWQDEWPQPPTPANSNTPPSQPPSEEPGPDGVPVFPSQLPEPLPTPS